MEQKKVRYTKPTDVPTVSTATFDDKCPVCHGRGWVLYKDYENDFYGKPTELEYAKRCPKCMGIDVDDFGRTGMPDLYKNLDISKFDFGIYQADFQSVRAILMTFINKYEKWEAESKGLYLWSKTPGSGKTFLACCLAKSVRIRTGKNLRFVTAPDYISMVGESYNRPKGSPDLSAIYRECDLLILDDIGTQISNEWQQQEMFRLIDARLNKGLVTIFTSNSKIDGLKLEDRTKNRIQKSVIVVHMPEESIRAQKATDEQKAFLERIAK